MSLKKFLLAIAVSLSIFVLYFGFGTNPDFEVIRIFGWKWGINYSDYAVVKLINCGTWFLYFMYLSIKDERDN